MYTHVPLQPEELCSTDFITVLIPGDNTTRVLLNEVKKLFPNEIDWDLSGYLFRVTTTPRAYLFFLTLVRPPVWPSTPVQTEGEFILQQQLAALNEGNASQN